VNGSGVPGIPVSWVVTGGGGSVSASSVITDGTGLAAVAWTLGPVAGSNAAQASAAGFVASLTGTGVAGPPASLTRQSGHNQTVIAGTALPVNPTVLAEDANGNPIAGAVVTFAVLTGNGSATSATAITGAGGLASVGWTLGTAAGSNSLQASTAGLNVTFSATGIAGPPTRLTITTQPGAGQSGIPLTVQPGLQLRDGNNNGVSQSGIGITGAIASGGGLLGGSVTVSTNVNGFAGFTDITVSGLVGARTLSFSSPGLTGVTSASFTIAAGPATILIKRVGDNQSAVAGTAVGVNPGVVVTDASNNPVAGVAVNFAVSTGGGTIEHASATTSSQGRVTGGKWTLGPVAGQNTLTVSSPGLSGSPAVFTATGTSGTGTPSSMVIVEGNNQSVVAGAVAPESLVVQVLDAGGTGVPGVQVSWTVLSGGGSLSSSATTTGPGGLAQVAWTFGILSGANSARATGASFTATFNGNGIAGPPALLIKQAGDNQSAIVGTAVPVNPAVLVTDANGNPVSGLSVAFTVITGGGSIELASSATSSQGIASGGTWVLGSVAGSNTLRASVPGLTGSPALFTATGTTAPHTPIPLIDMGSATYFGFPGGLYRSGNNLPALHAAAGAARARNIQPRNINGSPSATGKFVLLSIGLSNTTQEWCNGVPSDPCLSWTLSGRAAADAQVNHQEMVIANGARPGQEADSWDNPADVNYDLVRDNVLTPKGVSELQVEIVWLKVLNGTPTISLPSGQADAVRLVTQYGDILRSLKVRYPNLEMVFFASRSYGGYANVALNPEPFAYETGFAVKWIIQAQTDQMANGGVIVDLRAGNLNYNSAAPWVAWGPYFWADGLTPRSDGLVWSVSDFESDGTHPSTSGESKVGAMLLTFFKTNPRTSCWFLAAGTCP
jgi:hypothetical protein